MDGGAKQEEMADQIKREVKENAHRRRNERPVNPSNGQPSMNETVRSGGGQSMSFSEPDTSMPDINMSTPETSIEGTDSSLDEPSFHQRRRKECLISRKDVANVEAPYDPGFGRSDTILLAFYLEHLVPFLFPFYRPSLFEGGKAWIFELMISSPVVRQATLCQSSYFFSLARGAVNREAAWDKVLTQTTDAIGVLRQALQVIDGSGIADHTHGAVRILASIMQIYRFEVAVLSFHNWQNHLSAASSLFKQLLDSAGDVGCHRSSFEVIISRLGPSSSWSWSNQDDKVPSAEQTAFRFSSSLILLDDIVASTVLQERPQLYDYHYSLLGNSNGPAPIDIEAVAGIKNIVLLQIGDIAALDSWKQAHLRTGNLDAEELAHRAAVIKQSLQDIALQLETEYEIPAKSRSTILDVFALPTNQSPWVSLIWTYSAFIYLSIVAYGWRTASIDACCQVGRVIDLMRREISPTMLRTMVWPFCITGCIALPGQEVHFRTMVATLQPPSIFSTLHKALEVMENVWRKRNLDMMACDLAKCFQIDGNLILLV